MTTRVVANKVIASLLIVMGAIQITLAGALWEQRHDSEAFTHCTVRWQADFLKAYQARSSAATDVSNAMDEVIEAVDNRDSAAFGKAVDHYVAVRAAQDKKRADHPLPPLPVTVCGN